MNNNNNNEDFYLIEKVKEKNQDAFKVLMIKYQPRIFSALFGYVKSKEDAEDLTQLVEKILPYFTPNMNVTYRAIPELSIDIDVPLLSSCK